MSRDAAHYQALMMKAVDGLLTADEQHELDEHLATHPELAAELADYRDIKEVTDAMTQRLALDAAIEPPRMTPASKGWVRFAMSLWLLGMLVILGYGSYLVAIDHELPAPMKVGMALAATGTLLLLGYVLRVRARALGRDAYEEVDR